MNFHARNPGHRQTLIDDPMLIAGALEEMMRRFSMVSLFRKFARDTELAGVHMEAGDRIWASAVMDRYR